MIERREITNRTDWLAWRAEDITANPGPCLFGDGVHPHTTAYEQWAIKSKLVTPKSIDAKLLRRAIVVEKIAPDIIREERPGWEVGVNEDYYRDPVEHIGATPDLFARRPDIEGIGVVDIKSVGAQAFRNWQDNDTGETKLPMWMALQVNIQAGLVGATWGAVVPITIGDGGLDVEIIDVPIMPELFAKFRELAKDFWRRVAEKEPYDIDWGKDAATCSTCTGMTTGLRSISIKTKSLNRS